METKEEIAVDVDVNVELEAKTKTEKESPSIVTFRLGDENHPVNEDDEVIEYIGERIRALENLENCKNLTVCINYNL
jgi:hypothetical protein